MRLQDLTLRGEFEFRARQCVSKMVLTRCHPLAADIVSNFMVVQIG